MKFYDLFRAKLRTFHTVQFLRIMRLTIIIITVCFLQVSATSKAQMISLNEKNASLETIINKIIDQTSYYFIGNTKLIRQARPIDINVKDMGIEEVLRLCFADQPLDYSIANKTVVIRKKKKSAVKEILIPWLQMMVRGKVTDEIGKPLPGASVKLLNSQSGTTTDSTGNFSLQVPGLNSILSVSYISYETLQIKAESTFMNISLKPAQNDLSEILVVGYGTQKKANVLGAVTTVKGSEIQDLPVASLSNALAGRMGGVTVTQSGGKPGQAASVRIRAVGTMSGANDPLYVVDGVIVDKFTFDGIDVSEVENITVLKDAASAAVYGARAANGVMLVTTRKGKSGQAIISYSLNVGTDKAINIPESQTAWEQATMINNSLASSKVALSDPQYFTQDELEHFKTHSYNWIDEAWKNPTLTRHALNVSGGSDKVRYFMGGSYWYGTGSFNNLDYKKYNLRANIDVDITKDLTASLIMNTDTRNDMKPYWRYDGDGDNMEDLYKAFLFRTSMVPPYIDGKPVGNFVEWHPSEITTDHTGYNKKKFQEYNAILSLEYKIPFIPGLKAKASYNKYSRNSFIKQFSLPYTLYVFKTTGEHNHIVTDEVASTKVRNDGEFLLERYTNDESYQLNGYLTYAREFGRHSLDALFVYEQSEGTQDWFSGQRNYFISPLIDQMFGGSSDSKDHYADGSASESGRKSYVGRVSYNYDERYLAEASFRYDGSQRFAPGKRWGFFPSVSLGWRISKESFFPTGGLVNDLKLRGSVGLLGNDAIASWQWYQAYAVSSPGAVFGSVTSGIAPGAIANPDITWEKSLTSNLGLDLSMLNNKISVSAEFFKRHTTDIFGSRQETAPATFGATFPSQNYGIMNSTGFEVEAGFQNVTTSGIGYHIRGNIGYAVNKIIKWDQAANIRPYQSIIGQPNDRLMGFEATGILRTQADLDALPDGYTIFGAVPELGMLNLKDVRGATSDTPDNKIDDNDRVTLADHSTPPINYGFNLGGSFKGFAMDVQFQGLAGNQVMIDTRYAEIRPEAKAFSFWNDHWTPENPGAAMPRPRNDAGSTADSNFWLKDGSFLRCKNLTVSYDLPSSFISKIHIKKARVFFLGTNLFLLEDHIKWRDPEAASLRSYPLMKSLSLGLNISL